jgi:hypothetical protein
MHKIVWCTLLVGCGRYDFKPVVVTTDAPTNAPTDAPIDAPAYCTPLVTKTHADCVTAYANPTGAPDQTIYDCAQACDFGQCFIYNASACTTCSCQAYAMSYRICDLQTGMCTAPLSGTGCIGGSFYAGSPFNCTSANGLVFEGACIVRYLFTVGDC